MATLIALVCDDESPLRDPMVSDIHMPDVAGLELPRRMNALDPRAHSVASALDDVYLVVMMQDGYTGGVLTVYTDSEIHLAVVQQVEDEQAINRSTYNHTVDWALAENSTRGKTIDSRFRAETTATAETQYAHITALRYKEPGPAWGRRNKGRTSYC